MRVCDEKDQEEESIQLSSNESWSVHINSPQLMSARFFTRED